VVGVLEAVEEAHGVEHDPAEAFLEGGGIPRPDGVGDFRGRVRGKPADDPLRDAVGQQLPDLPVGRAELAGSGADGGQVPGVGQDAPKRAGFEKSS
jgi:hypothetical protein